MIFTVLNEVILSRGGMSATPHRADIPRACWDTVNKRAVRILLECIIVFPVKTRSVNKSSLCLFVYIAWRW